jgi:hypothetical protein
MNKVIAFIKGVVEYKSDLTTHYDYPLIEWYDRGRQLMRGDN